MISAQIRCGMNVIEDDKVTSSAALIDFTSYVSIHSSVILFFLSYYSRQTQKVQISGFI